MNLKPRTTTKHTVVTYIDEDGEQVSALLWDVHWDDSTTITGIDPATWCPVTISCVLSCEEL